MMARPDEHVRLVGGPADGQFMRISWGTTYTTIHSGGREHLYGVRHEYNARWFEHDCACGCHTPRQDRTMTKYTPTPLVDLKQHPIPLGWVSETALMHALKATVITSSTLWRDEQWLRTQIRALTKGGAEDRQYIQLHGDVHLIGNEHDGHALKVFGNLLNSRQDMTTTAATLGAFSLCRAAPVSAAVAFLLARSDEHRDAVVESYTSDLLDMGWATENKPKRWTVVVDFEFEREDKPTESEVKQHLEEALGYHQPCGIQSGWLKRVTTGPVRQVKS